MTNEIKLNHPCVVCKEVIYLGEGTIINKRILHFSCFEKEILEKIRVKLKDRFVAGKVEEYSRFRYSTIRKIIDKVIDEVKK